MRATERLRDTVLKERQRAEEQRAKDAEARWEGRAGGMELRLPAMPGAQRADASMERAGSPLMRSAPLPAGAIDPALSDNPLMPRSLGSGGLRK